MKVKKVIAKKCLNPYAENGEVIELFFPEAPVGEGYFYSWCEAFGHGMTKLNYFNDGLVVPLPENLKSIYEKNWNVTLVEANHA